MLGSRIKLTDTIGIVAPAFAASKEEVDSGIAFLKSLGFKVKCGKHIYDRWGYYAGKDKDRAEDFINMLQDKEVKMILAMRGGYGTIRILPYINKKLIVDNPKIIAGFSDLTVLLNYFSQVADTVTFHSPMATSNLKDKITLESFLNNITNGNKPYIIKNPENIHCNTLIPGSAEGILCGGNLSLLCTSLNTPYEIDTKDKILFIEEIDEEPYVVDRFLTQLLLSGKLQCCRGFILGQFKDCSLPHYERSLTLEEVIEDRILTLNKPTISNFMSGHDYPKLTLPIGAKVKLNCNNNTIEVLDKVVR